MNPLMRQFQRLDGHGTGIRFESGPVHFTGKARSSSMASPPVIAVPGHTP